MSQITEMQKLFTLLPYITTHYAAIADAKFYLKKRKVEITVDEGGKTIYAVTLEIDSPAIEAKCRLVRHELERMIDECRLPILGVEVAA